LHAAIQWTTCKQFDENDFGKIECMADRSCTGPRWLCWRRSAFRMKAIFVKLAYPYGVDAITLLALRMGFSLPVFLWVGLVEQRAGASLSRADWGRLFLLAALAITAPAFSTSGGWNTFRPGWSG
jgi:hypothetical protein